MRFVHVLSAFRAFSVTDGSPRRQFQKTYRYAQEHIVWRGSLCSAVHLRMKYVFVFVSVCEWKSFKRLHGCERVMRIRMVHIIQHGDDALRVFHANVVASKKEEYHQQSAAPDRARQPRPRPRGRLQMNI